MTPTTWGARLLRQVWSGAILFRLDVPPADPMLVGDLWRASVERLADAPLFFDIWLQHHGGILMEARFGVRGVRRDSMPGLRGGRLDHAYKTQFRACSRA